MARSNLTEAERFARIGWIVSESGCWNWSGYVSPKGYGRFNSKVAGALAHRFALSLRLGRPIPRGVSVLHSCDNPRCVNPNHLREGTHGDNMQEASQRGRFPQAKVTVEQVREIRDRVTRESVASLAREFGVVPAAIRKIRDRQNWSWVE